jgi:hypothetical protein
MMGGPRRERERERERGFYRRAPLFTMDAGD